MGPPAKFKKGDIVKHRLGGGHAIVVHVDRTVGGYSYDVEFVNDNVLVRDTYQEESMVLVESYEKAKPVAKEPEKEKEW